MKHLDLTDDQLLKINSFCGHGELKNADILFLGNEEGLDRNEIEKVINDRCNAALTNKCLIDKDYTRGHYHVSDGYEGNGNTIQMIMFQARILLSLNDPDGDWFSNSGDNSEAFNTIKKYHWHQIYREGKEWLYGSALTELRPLPRRNESKWPFGNLDRKEYIEAFRFNKKQKKFSNAITQLRDGRIKILENVLTECGDIKVIVGIGDRESKKKFFQNLYGDIGFNEFRINGKKCYSALLELDGRRIHLFLCNYFSGGWKHNLQLEDLPELTERIRSVLS